MRRCLLLLFALLPAGVPEPARPPAAHPREEQPLPCEVLATAEGACWKMIHLRLAERLDESRLLAIRARLLQSEPRPWDRFTCRFYLPGTDLADGPWADANDLGVWAIEPPAPPIETFITDGVTITRWGDRPMTCADGWIRHGG